MKNRTLFVRAPIVATLSLVGCVDRGGWQQGPQLAPQSLTATRALGSERPDAAAWPADDWWHSYGDPQLDALVQEALAANPSLAIAQARLRAAQGQAVAARAPLLPKGTFNGELDRQRFPVDGFFPPPFAGSYSNHAELTLDFSYDLDFWGHNRALAAAASSGVQAAEADRASARLALAVAVVRAYVQLDLWYALLDVAQDNLTQQQAILDLTQQRVAAGLENEARVKQSEGNVALTRAGVDAAQASIDLTGDQLAELVAAGPDRGLDVKRPQLGAPARLRLPAVLPADLIGRRPDVAAARARVEAATHGIKAAEASFYPDVNLTAFAGFSSLELSKLFDAANHVDGAGVALSLPVFNRRTLTGTLYVNQAQLDQSVAQYNQTLLDAIRQVADVVANWRALERESSEQRTALSAAQRAYDLTTERYRAGLDNYLSVLSSQNQVLLAQALGAQLTARRLSFSVDLALALGGGYASPAPVG